MPQQPQIVTPFRRPAPDDPNLAPRDRRAMLEAMKRSEKFAVEATCHVSGSARVSAGSVVWLIPRGRTPWSRLWYVTSCWHVFEGSDTSRENDPRYFLRLGLADRDLPADPAPHYQRPEDRPPLPQDVVEPPEEGDNIMRPIPNIPPPPILVPTQPPVIPPLDPIDPDDLDPGVVDPYDPTPPPLSTNLPGPTCPVQPAPFLPTEWRSPYPSDPTFDVVEAS